MYIDIEPDIKPRCTFAQQEIIDLPKVNRQLPHILREVPKVNKQTFSHTQMFHQINRYSGRIQPVLIIPSK
jgi:hypothetical protein